jgi:hypothetical protein
MTQISDSPCIFIHRDYDIVLALYVDDILMASLLAAFLQQFIEWISEAFKIRDLGIPTHFLGMNISYDREKGEVLLSQVSYIDTLIKRFNIQDSPPTSIPIKPGVRFNKLQGQESPTTQPFSSLIGGLLFLSICTRPDIAFAVFSLSRFLKQPGQIHWEAAIDVLRYLKGTRTRGIRFGDSIQAGDSLICYSDADFANDMDDRKSVTGGIIFRGISPISWTSKKQKVISTSTAEAECKLLITIANNLSEFGI